VTWGNRDRLLLAPLGTSKSLLCAAFPEKGTLTRPTTSQPSRKLRLQPPKETGKKKQSSRQRGKKRSQERHPSPSRSSPATTPKSSYNRLCDGQYPETAAQSPIASQWPQPEPPQMPHDSQLAMDSMQGEIGPPGQWHQMDGFSPRQMISEQHTYPQASQGFGVLGADGWWMDTGAAGCIDDPGRPT
jgi:hypothetical protein